MTQMMLQNIHSSINDYNLKENESTTLSNTIPNYGLENYNNNRPHSPIQNHVLHKYECIAFLNTYGDNNLHKNGGYCNNHYHLQ
jgi:hypothetical protein